MIARFVRFEAFTAFSGESGRFLANYSIAFSTTFPLLEGLGQTKVLISFDTNEVVRRHGDWLKSVEARTALNEFDPQPYWGFDDLRHKAGSKLTNCFYIGAEVKREDGKEFFRYSDIRMMQRFELEGLLKGLEEGWAFVDFDARNGHNHGTKFRIQQNRFPSLYQHVHQL